MFFRRPIQYSAGRLVADPETTFGHRGDDRDIAREKISSG
jgi:hypothetical protein